MCHLNRVHRHCYETKYHHHHRQGYHPKHHSHHCPHQLKEDKLWLCYLMTWNTMIMACWYHHKIKVILIKYLSGKPRVLALKDKIILYSKLGTESGQIRPKYEVSITKLSAQAVQLTLSITPLSLEHSPAFTAHWALSAYQYMYVYALQTFFYYSVYKKPQQKSKRFGPVVHQKRHYYFISRNRKITCFWSLLPGQ